MPTSRTIAVWVALLGIAPEGHAVPATVTQSALGALPALRTPLITGSHSPPPIPREPDTAAEWALADLRAAMARDVPGQLHLSASRIAALIERAHAMLSATGTAIGTPQLVLTVDRNPASQTIALFLARPGTAPWSLVGATHVSTGQAGRKDYYITPVGVFRHTDAILDFRAQGTYNEHHVRGLGLAGMRVWDFGWQWALKGWHTDGEGGDIRLQMHATDPTLLERRLGRPASEGCVRVSSAMNRFLDHYGVLDADYDRVAITDIRYRQLLQPDHTPTPLAGRLLIVVDSRDPVDEAPTAASRPANWPPPK
jgi:hypothetical protein